VDVEYLTTRPESIQSRDEERRLTAAPHMNNEGLRSKDREVIATLQSGGRFFHCDLLTCPVGLCYGS